MNRYTKFLVLAFAATVSAFGQCVLTPTTLSVAVTSSSATGVVLTSATPNSTTTCPGSNAVVGNVLYVDRELMTIRAVNGTFITVIRGQGGTPAAQHSSNALVFVGLPNQFSAGIKQGRCVRTSELVLPVVDARTGAIYDCIGGNWTGGGTAGTTTAAPYRTVSPNPGGTAYTSINTTGTAPGAATTMYCTELVLTGARLLTGLAVLNGTTVGTDKHLMVLYDSTGNPLANSATAGATTSGASTYQAFAFTSTYFAVAGKYLGCMQTNGTTDTVRMSVTGVNDNLITGSITGQTFGTIATITAPTTYTTAVGPYIYGY
jgi:hypothetical protein